ncbi:hypothetical protein E2P81_ATG05689 [Venturia nashicola]|uniref:Arrestin C-terminal-like domain-containing protein n=1 Tax=Venturia nashicola TaxID=86259 RepID=A0A4Z1NVP0_9PEZI|nr:hypothetical protein E6O75_ATG05828 [Venturia nashicola]TLD29395.1 hypothetical protein E2P81_ATG05689 [Venturia nashicola]
MANTMSAVDRRSHFGQTATGYIQVQSERGRLYYLPHSLHQAFNLAENPRPSHFQSRSLRPHRIHIARVVADPIAKRPGKQRTKRFTVYLGKFGKLADSRDSAKKFFRAIFEFREPRIPQEVQPPLQAPIQRPVPEVQRPRARPASWASGATPAPLQGRPRRRRPTSVLWGERRNSSTVGDNMGLNSRHTVALPVGPSAPRHSVDETTSPRNSVASFPMTASNSRSAEEKPLATGNGITVSIAMAEPYLFLQGFEHGDLAANRNTAMLRGRLHIRVSKPSKIKAVTLRFRGRAITKWPEGLPPKKTEFEEVIGNTNHTWPFFNAQFPTAETSTGADHVELFKSSADMDSDLGAPRNRSSLALPMRNANRNSNNLSTRELKKLSLQVNQSRSFGKGDSPTGGPTVAQKGYRTFQPGDYVYNFELPLDSHLPETIDVELGSVKYELEALVERAGAFKTNLVGTKEVIVIRTPAEGSLEQVEPIAISRNWEDQLHYDIVISGKSFPLGAQIPIAFKLTPLAKVQCHRIKVFVTESIEYWAKNKSVHRTDAQRKVQLFEKRADAPATSTFPGSTMRILSGGGVPYDLRAQAARGEEVPIPDSTNLLGPLQHDNQIGPTEMEFNIQLPSCDKMKIKDNSSRLHFDTTYSNITVHHWIKIVMRLSKPDAADPSRRRHFEISIDSPFHILSCRATQANTSLPAYTSPESSDAPQSLTECGCPGSAIRRVSPTSFVPTLNSLNAAGPPPQFAESSASSSSSSSSASSQRRPYSMFTTPSGGIPGLARPETAHVGGPMHQQAVRPVSHQPMRPMHIIRAPSFNPPAFEDEEPPPPLETPPPQYNDIVTPSTDGMVDYFARLAEEYNTDEESDSEGGTSDSMISDGGMMTPRGGRSRARVEIPLTPGSRRVNRSLDEVRTWPTLGMNRGFVLPANMGGSGVPSGGVSSAGVQNTRQAGMIRLVDA